MEKTQLYIPDKCKVGLQLRQGTYTGKLGYIIYHDGKVWRKETSWNSWRHEVGRSYSIWNPETRDREEGVHDESVAPIEFDNTPTEGFVLNKKAGGYSSGWNHRQTYSRVYDPRGWEFEITVENLIYILQECNSYKGKGLEGEFVYSWAGKDLVLLPVTSPDYIASQEFTDLQSVKFSKKDLIEGHTYLTNRMEEWVYLGRYDVYDDSYSNKTEVERRGDRIEKKVTRKKHVFVTMSKKYGSGYEFLTSFARIKKRVSEDVHPKFAEYVDEFQRSIYASEADYLVVEPFSKEFIKDNLDRDYLWHTKVYRFININSDADLLTARKSIKKYENGPDYEIYTESPTRDYSWNRQVNNVSEGVFTLEELKQNYGMLMRVYKNGFKTQA